ncbi:MAG: lysophospholipid acyltransferase family protein [Phycisphaeraceae bacterium]
MTYFPPNAPPRSAAPDSNRPAGPEPVRAPAPRLNLRQKFAAFWLGHLFWAAHHAPWYARFTVGFWITAAWLFSPALRRNTLANARHILGKDATDAQCRRLAKNTIRSFFMFVYDVGRHGRMSAQEMRQDVASVEGSHHYDEAKKLGRGVIVATAHFGAFESAVASLLETEPKIHVVFQRDRSGAFEQVRSRLHQRLGVIEHPIDDGLSAWADIREALERGEAVLMQADRVMPGQRGTPMPFFDSHIEMPLGPAKLAAMTRSPIVPVFAVRLPGGKIRIENHPAIHVDIAAQADSLSAAVSSLTQLIEVYVRKYPEQWLVIHQPWVRALQPHE